MPPLPEPMTSIFVFLVGLVLGSFLNVCILRLPHGQSIVHPRSRCPNCQHLIRWYENVPVISWLLLGRKCSQCSTPISWRYPFIELLSGAAVLAAWLGFGPTDRFLIVAAFTLALVVLFFTDLDHQLLPDAVTLTGTVVGLGIAWFNPFLDGSGWERIWLSLGGAALGSGILWGIGALWSRLRGVEAMGMGDVKMMAMVGAFTGPWGVLLTIFGASAGGAIVGLLAVPLRGRTLQDTLPFGCFLAPAALAALIVGRAVVDAYFQALIPPP